MCCIVENNIINSFKSMKLKIVALAILLMINFSLAKSAETVLVYGQTFSKSSKLHKKLASKNYNVMIINDLNLDCISLKQGKLLIVSGEENLHPESRERIDKYLINGGNVVVAGTRAFDYAPILSGHPVSIVDFGNSGTYNIVKQTRKFQPRNLEEPAISTNTVEGMKTFQMSTKEKGMGDYMVEVPVKDRVSQDLSLLTFKAKGNEYMDVLGLEVVDSKGKKWFSFVKISPEWESYAISFADFIPEGWKNTMMAYPLLKPENISKVYLGVNTRSVWSEKAMMWEIGEVCLAKNNHIYYTPTSRINSLRLPFFEMDITLPEVFFDPFSQVEKSENISSLVRNENYPFGKANIQIPSSALASIPKMFVELPGIRGGTDVLKSYDFRNNREKRIIPIYEIAENLKHVAKIEQYAGGRYRGASIALFGVNPNDIISNATMLDDLTNVVSFMLDKPTVANVRINTTQKRSNVKVTPKIRVSLRNPLDYAVNGTLSCSVNSGILEGESSVNIPANALLDVELALSEVPTDFPYSDFEWKVTLETSKGVDIFEDKVDVERSLLMAFRLLVNSQKKYPDGRLSNHYFADAYGIRSMFGYLDLLKKEPDRLKKNSDIWATLKVEDIENSAYRFMDMLAERQIPDGGFPMGYLENRYEYNVADGGQMAYSISQIIPYVTDPQKKIVYKNTTYKFVEWAEEFYIDKERSEELKRLFPEAAAKGHCDPGMYGTYQRGNYRMPTGPHWVGSCILPTQIHLAYVDKNPDPIRQQLYRSIADRNIKFTADKMFTASGYYQAEAIMLAMLFAKSSDTVDKLKKNIEDTFIPPLLEGKENDMFEVGSRRTLNALSMIYYQKFIENESDLRAALLKYVWTFGSHTSTNGIELIADAFPKPIMGESLSASKYASLSSVWAMELLRPNSTLFENPSPIIPLEN